MLQFFRGFLILILGFLPFYHALSHYCARIHLTQDDGILSFDQAGYFWMTINNGKAFYHYDINFDDIKQCNLIENPTLSYHIHEKGTVDVTKFPQRSCANTGGHYDPHLACGESSSGHNSYCLALNRTNSQGYKYNCYQSISMKRYLNPSGYCEIGDLAGKFGTINLETNNRAQSQSKLKDVIAPYLNDYKASSLTSTSTWASIVLHCTSTDGSSSVRIACGDFQIACGIKRKHRRLQPSSNNDDDCPYSC